MAIKKQLKNVLHAFKTKSGKWILLAAAIGGPIGMTGYVMTINYMSASIGAIASAIFPAIGAILAYIFLKEKMKWYQWTFLILSIIGVLGLSYTPSGRIANFWLGLLGTLMCSIGWGVEAVIVAHGMKDPEVTDEFALMIRQTTSAIIYGIIIIPILRGWSFTTSLFVDTGVLIPAIAGAAICGTASYVFYYKAITDIGASKAMALNITYVAWALVFTVLILHDKSVISPVTIFCAILVIVGSVFAAADIKEMFKRSDKQARLT